MINFLIQLIQMATQTMAGATSGAATGATNVALETTQTVQNTADEVADTTLSINNYMSTTLRQIAIAAQSKAETIAAQAANTARAAVSDAVARAGDIALQSISDAKNIFLQGSMLARVYKTLKFIIRLIRKIWPILKWIFIFTKLMNTIGVWAFRMVEVIIYRIFHLKHCIFWYLLETVGIILYIVMEFFVWLLCLQSWEKTFWTLVEEADCLFYSMTKYHIFHYSDQILKKCYAVQMPPLPFKSITFQGDGDFDEKAMLKMVIYWMLPPSPDEIGQATKLLFDMLGELSGSVKETAQSNNDEAQDSYEKTSSDSSQGAAAINGAQPQ